MHIAYASLAAVFSCFALAIVSGNAIAHMSQINSTNDLPAWAIAAHAQALQAEVLGVSSASIPPTIPAEVIVKDSSGAVETFRPNGLTDTSANAFFQSLGDNGRTCFSCHEPQDGWVVSVNWWKSSWRQSSASEQLTILLLTRPPFAD